ncbi:hypothetical protein F4815DRAFT_451793 [Daldinia loculata]|nr:hypothetical protein F4815DRAFT_451793 [Daldinia loculata]
MSIGGFMLVPDMLPTVWGLDATQACLSRQLDRTTLTRQVLQEHLGAFLDEHFQTKATSRLPLLRKIEVSCRITSKLPWGL